MKNTHSNIFGRLAVLTCLPAAALAVSPDAGQILNEQQKLQQKPRESLARPEDKPLELAAPAADAVKVLVNTIRFSGAEGVASEAELQAQVADAIGREFDYAGLQQLAERITRFLKAKGYLLARAYLPAQEIAGGVLEIAIQVGRVEGKNDGDGIEIQANGTRLNKAIIRGTVARAVFADGENAPVRTENLERGLLLLNDMPGIAARATLQRGGKPGVSKLAVSVDEGALVTGRVSEDNFGSRYTGKWRTGFEANLNDPFGRGDQVTATFTKATDMNLAGFNYRLPVGVDGLFVGANYSYLDYGIGQELSVLDAKGNAHNAGMNVGYPFYRSRDFSLWGGLSYAYKWLQDRAFDVVVHDKQTHAVTASVSGNYRDEWMGDAVSGFGVSISGGDVDLSGSKTDLATDNRSARSHGGYVKANYNVSRLQRLSDGWSLFWGVNGQLAGNNLDSSEKFLLGGPFGVRAYSTGEGVGDTGWLTNVELRYELPTLSGSDHWQLVGFFDSGRITEHETSWAGSITNAESANRYGLSGAGIGLNFTYAKQLFVRGSVANAVGRNPGRDIHNLNADGRKDNTQFWLQAELRF